MKPPFNVFRGFKWKEVMGILISGRRYDILDAAQMANPDAEVKLQTSPEGVQYTWMWEDKSHSLHIPENHCTDEIILERLFQAAIEMARK